MSKKSKRKRIRSEFVEGVLADYEALCTRLPVPEVTDKLREDFGKFMRMHCNDWVGAMPIFDVVGELEVIVVELRGSMRGGEGHG